MTDTGTPIQVDWTVLIVGAIVVVVACAIPFVFSYLARREAKEYTAPGQPHPAF